jgi:hypothetical protein
VKHIIRKIYWDYEKEEKWLNEMSAKGLALTDYSWCRYVFTETPDSEYTYRIELMEHRSTHVESAAYIRFLEESGVECVATYIRWIYLRKKTSEGSFDIYSDIESKIRHYKRINLFYNTLMWLELGIGLFNIIIGIINLSLGSKLGSFSYVNIIEGFALILLGLFFYRLGLPTVKKIKMLRQEKAIRE